MNEMKHWKIGAQPRRRPARRRGGRARPRSAWIQRPRIQAEGLRRECVPVSAAHKTSALTRTAQWRGSPCAFCNRLVTEMRARQRDRAEGFAVSRSSPRRRESGSIGQVERLIGADVDGGRIHRLTVGERPVQINAAIAGLGQFRRRLFTGFHRAEHFLPVCRAGLGRL